MHYIYVLRDPMTKKIRYVGRTSQPEKRKMAHRYTYSGDNSAVSVWKRELAQAGKIAEFEIIDRVENYGESKRLETRWIVGLFESGHELLNRNYSGAPGYPVSKERARKAAETRKQKRYLRALREVSEWRNGEQATEAPGA